MFKTIRFLVFLARTLTTLVFGAGSIIFILYNIRLFMDLWSFVKHGFKWVYDYNFIGSHLLFKMFPYNTWTMGIFEIKRTDFIVTCFTYMVSSLFLIVILFNAIGITKMLLNAMLSRTDIRQLMGREKDIQTRICNLVNEVRESHNSIFGSELTNVEVKVIDSRYQNAMVFFNNTMVLTTEVINANSDETLKGIIAHEFGHIFNKDILFSKLLFANALVSDNLNGKTNRFISKIYHLIIRNQKVGGVLALPMMFCFFPYFLFYFVMLMIDTVLVCIDVTIGREQEFIADSYSSKLGYKEGLLNFLYRDMQEQENLHQIMGIYNVTSAAYESFFRTHPASLLRIARLEKNA